MTSYIVSAKRSAICKYGGALSQMTATQIMKQIISYLGKTSLTAIEEVYIGCVLQACQGQNPARQAFYGTSIRVDVPATTLNLVCGSGLKSIQVADQAISTGERDVILAGGMESMSNVPYYLQNHRFGKRIGDDTLVDGMMLDGLYCSLIDQKMGITAENIAKRYNISRADQDLLAYTSQMRAIKSIQNGIFNEEIVPIQLQTKKGVIQVKTDEQPRADTTLEALAKLKPAFLTNGTVTAGNSSTINDGAAVVVLASEKGLKKHNLTPIVEVIACAHIALDPAYMGMGASYAAKECIKKSGINADDIGIWEINEAFAAQSIAVVNDLKIDPKRVNVRGGAIALGHPIGASGTRVVVTLVHEMKRKKSTYGLASLCIGGGQGVSILLKLI
ncbi:thiolase family protein [Candidatus Woesebacteria bacterium]|nr:thiolase family protein [Candidatus Woesebacteria bacterium]